MFSYIFKKSTSFFETQNFISLQEPSTILCFNLMKPTTSHHFFFKMHFNIVISLLVSSTLFRFSD
jgi:hypothetical protein